MSINPPPHQAPPARACPGSSVCSTVVELDLVGRLHEGSLYHVPRYYVLNVFDDFYRELMALENNTLLCADLLVRVLDRLKETGALPAVLRIDYGQEFISVALADWRQADGIFIDDIGSVMHYLNACIERFNRSLKGELLDIYLFGGLERVVSSSVSGRTNTASINPHDLLDVSPPSVYTIANLNDLILTVSWRRSLGE